MKTKKNIIALFIIAAITIFPHYSFLPLPFLYTIPIIGLIWIALISNAENFTAVYFSFKKITLHSFFIGALAGIFLFFFTTYIFFPLISKFVSLHIHDLGDFATIKNNTPKYIFMIIMGWIVGGLYEELVFRGYIFSTIEKIFASPKATLISFMVTNIIFALYHVQLGIIGVLNALIAGLVYHSLMLYFKRNMWYAIFCHAIFDTIALTYIYAGYQ
jgi:uncharacterized protein